jgi:hypothetical protein
MSIYDDPSAWVEIACRFCHSVFSIYEPTDEQLRGYICDDCSECIQDGIGRAIPW